MGDGGLIITRRVTKQWLLPMGMSASYELGKARAYLNLWRVLTLHFASQGLCMAVINSDTLFPDALSSRIIIDLGWDIYERKL